MLAAHNFVNGPSLLNAHNRNRNRNPNRSGDGDGRRSELLEQNQCSAAAHQVCQHCCRPKVYRCCTGLDSSGPSRRQIQIIPNPSGPAVDLELQRGAMSASGERQI